MEEGGQPPPAGTERRAEGGERGVVVLRVAEDEYGVEIHRQQQVGGGELAAAVDGSEPSGERGVGRIAGDVARRGDHRVESGGLPVRGARAGAGAAEDALGAAERAQLPRAPVRPDGEQAAAGARARRRDEQAAPVGRPGGRVRVPRPRREPAGARAARALDEDGPAVAGAAREGELRAVGRPGGRAVVGAGRRDRLDGEAGRGEDVDPAAPRAGGRAVRAAARPPGRGPADEGDLIGGRPRRVRVVRAPEGELLARRAVGADAVEVAPPGRAAREDDRVAAGRPGRAAVAARAAGEPAQARAVGIDDPQVAAGGERQPAPARGERGIAARRQEALHRPVLAPQDDRLRAAAGRLRGDEAVGAGEGGVGGRRRDGEGEERRGEGNEPQAWCAADGEPVHHPQPTPATVRRCGRPPPPAPRALGGSRVARRCRPPPGPSVRRPRLVP